MFTFVLKAVLKTRSTLAVCFLGFSLHGYTAAPAPTCDAPNLRTEPIFSTELDDKQLIKQYIFTKDTLKKMFCLQNQNINRKKKKISAQKKKHEAALASEIKKKSPEKDKILTLSDKIGKLEKQISELSKQQTKAKEEEVLLSYCAKYKNESDKKKLTTVAQRRLCISELKEALTIEKAIWNEWLQTASKIEQHTQKHIIKTIDSEIAVLNGKKQTIIEEPDTIEKILTDPKVLENYPHVSDVIDILNTKSIQMYEFKEKLNTLNNNMSYILMEIDQNNKYQTERYQLGKASHEDNNTSYYHKECENIAITINPKRCPIEKTIKNQVKKSRYLNHDDEWIQNKNINDQLNRITNTISKKGEDILLGKASKADVNNLLVNVNQFYRRYIGTSRFNVAMGVTLDQIPEFKIEGRYGVDFSEVNLNYTPENSLFERNQILDGRSNIGIALTAITPWTDLNLSLPDYKNDSIEVIPAELRPTEQDTQHWIRTEIKTSVEIDYDLSIKLGLRKVLEFTGNYNNPFIPSRSRDLGILVGVTNIHVTDTFSSIIRAQTEDNQSFIEANSGNDVTITSENEYSILPTYIGAFYQNKIGDQFILDLDFKHYTDDKKKQNERISIENDTISISIKYIWF